MKKNDGHIYFKDQWHDAMYYLFSLDSPLWRTFKGLMTNPGRVGNEYISGKRKNYYTPIKYFILATAVYLLLTKITGFNVVKMQFLALGQTPHENPVSDMMRNNINYFLFILVLLMAFISRLFFPRQRRSYPENVAYFFFVVGHFILLNVIFIPLSFITPVFVLIKYGMLFYIIWAIFSFYKGNIAWRLIRSMLMGILGYLLYAVTVFGISLAIFRMTH